MTTRRLFVQSSAGASALSFFPSVAFKTGGFTADS
jgi:hypothetical protein